MSQLLDVTVGLAWPVVTLIVAAIAAATASRMQDRYLTYKRFAQGGAEPVQPRNPQQTQQTDPMHAKIQAFSHLSRMHSSVATAFFTTLLAYTSYLIALQALGLSRTSDVMKVVLTLLPLPVVIVQGAKYYATNIAFKNCAMDIKFDGSDLYAYIWGSSGVYAKAGKVGAFWIKLTQPAWGWSLLSVFVVVLWLCLWFGLSK